jgi:trans-2,3-dihydro-3-hydroxyanthranilate isomerase
MRKFRMKQVDVFTDKPLAGNPLAVVLDGQGLDTEEMQAIAKEMNLSETTFILAPTKPEADYKVRIFTPSIEMPFAGHPSIGTAHALVEDGKISLKEQLTTVRQEVGIGVLPIEIEQLPGRGRMITMTQGKPRLGRTMTEIQELAQALMISAGEIAYDKLPVQISSTGLNQLMVPLRSLEQVAALAPDYERLKEFEKRFQLEGCYAFALKASDPKASVHARFFIPSAGVPEDPATGSAAGALGAYLVSHKVFGSKTLVSFNVEQGAEIGRPSTITVTVHQDGGIPDIVKVGGTAVTVLNGEITL